MGTHGNRILNRNQRFAANRIFYHFTELQYYPRMRASNGRHLDDFSLDKFDPVVFGEDADPAHAVVVIRGETITVR